MPHPVIHVHIRSLTHHFRHDTSHSILCRSKQQNSYLTSANRKHSNQRILKSTKSLSKFSKVIHY